jgi:hypothetical protein
MEYFSEEDIPYPVSKMYYIINKSPKDESKNH